MKKLLILAAIAAFSVACSSAKYINKEKCVEIGGPVLECKAEAVLK